MDNLSRSLRNTFVVNAIDRVHCHRGDADWLRAQLKEETSCIIPVHKDQLLTSTMDHPQPICIPNSVLEDYHIARRDLLFLGQYEDRSYFAASVNGDTAQEIQSDVAEFSSLRNVAVKLDPVHAALLAQAKAMTYWHQQHLFCGACGSPTEADTSGYMRTCTNPDCGQQHFPRVDPAVIMRVTHDENILLGRQPHWNPGRYSNIAGFVEPGESLETAVAREVWEETGVRIISVDYHSSQPWPFPTSLMLGFTAIAGTTDITLRDGELQAARWFTREEIKTGLEADTFGLPSNYSISYHLIEDWFDDGECGPLAPLMRSW